MKVDRHSNSIAVLRVYWFIIMFKWFTIFAIDLFIRFI
jgi:hypothetical protein